MGAEKTAKKQRRGKPFEPGQSGNPDGRPKGARNMVTRAVEALLDGQAETLTQKAIDKALEGDMTALRLCLERICPPRKSRPVCFDLPNLDTGADTVSAFDAILRAMAAGELTTDEATAVAGILESRRRASDLAALEERIAQLERSTPHDGQRRHSAPAHRAP